MRLVFATNNKNKLREVKEILSDLPLEIVDLSDFPQIGDIEETGATFQQNASIKANEVRKHDPDAIIIADDSGLCVEALNGAPGVYSARYAGKGATGEQLCKKLLADLKNKQDRRAYFVSVYAISIPAEDISFAEGRLQGEISEELRGNEGFGYDPIFVFEDGDGRTLAEISLEQKNKISHRARALQQVKDILKKKI